MNYIKHLTKFYNRVIGDENISSTQISLYLALFQYWNLARFRNPIIISRDEIMKLSKIASTSTYHRAISYLHNHHYIEYKPSYNPYRGSLVEFNEFSSDKEADLSLNPTLPRNSLLDNQVNNLVNDQQKEPIINNRKAYQTNSANRERAPMNKYLDNQNLSSSDNRPHQFLEKEKNSAKKESDMPPAKHAVEEYFFSQSSSLQEAHRFLNHYSANGWLVGGRSPMRDWKASARNWIANTTTFNNHGNASTKPRAQQLNVKTDKNFFEPL